MTSRSIYQFLLRLHPACFRKRYEDQMLWVFDESIRSRGAAALLVDAVVSLARQWVLRSKYWRNNRPVASYGPVVFQRNAQSMHRLAWRLNFLWLLAAWIVYLICPLTSHWNGIFPFVFITGWIAYTSDRRGEFPTRVLISIPWTEKPDIRNRAQLEGKRDGLRAWYGRKPAKKTSYNGFGGGVMILLGVVTIAMMIRVYLRNDVVMDRARLWEFLVGQAFVIVSWFLLRRINERAAKAFQQEIDILDNPDAPHSV